MNTKQSSLTARRKRNRLVNLVLGSNKIIIVCNFFFAFFFFVDVFFPSSVF